MADPQPSNPLEQLLIAAKQDHGALGQFFDALLKSEVYVLAANPPPASSALESSGEICVLANAAGERVVPVFTTRDKASPWHERQPRFQYGLLVNAASLIDGIGTEVGLVVNPGHAIGVEIPSKAVAALRRQPPAPGSVN